MDISDVAKSLEDPSVPDEKCAEMVAACTGDVNQRVPHRHVGSHTCMCVSLPLLGLTIERGRSLVLGAFAARGDVVVNDDSKDPSRLSPVYLAAMYTNGTLPALLRVFGKRIDINATCVGRSDLGWSVLHVAVASGSCENVEAALLYGADTTFRSKAGLTPALLALQLQHAHIYDQIQAYKVWVNSQRCWWMTACLTVAADCATPHVDDQVQHKHAKAE